jgi:hypothetical protein
MRHFHDTLIGAHSYFTLVVNWGEYELGTPIDETLRKDSILGELAQCLEIPFDKVASYIVGPSDPYGDNGLAPNECRALDEFMDYYRTVRSAYEKQSPEPWKGTWLYTNLNEGKSVAWSVYLG